MSLFNQHWINFNGESVTGRTPPVTRIMNGVEMTEPQRAGVAHAYKLLTDALNVTPVKSLVQNRILPDGTKVRMVSNFGVDEVLVWPAGADAEEVAPFSGIGVCLATASGAAITDWLFTDDDGDHPQPYILTPGRKKVGGVFVSTGKWKRQAVSRLVGGQQLWVSKNRKQWFSNFAGLRYQQPESSFTTVNITSYYPLTINPEWTAISTDRVQFSYVGEDPVASAGKYLFRMNDTVALSNRHSTYQVSSRKLKVNGVEGEFVHVVVPKPSTTPGFYIQRGIYKPVLGLAEEDATFDAPGVYLDFQPEIDLSIPEGNVRSLPTTLSVHPDGTKAICLSRTLVGGSWTTRGGYITLYLDAVPTYMISDSGISTKSENTSGTGAWSVNTVRSPRHYRQYVFSSACDPIDGTLGEQVLTTQLSGSLASTLTKNASGNATGKTTRNELNRYYYAHNGDEVKEIWTYETDSQVAFNFTGVRVIDPGDEGVEKVHTTISTLTATASATCDVTYTEKIDLGKRTHIVDSQRDNGSVSYIITEENIAIDASINHSRTVKTTLFYDYVNDFIIYYEQVYTASASGSKNFAFAPTDGLDVGSLVTGSVTGRFVAECGGAEVLSHSVSIPTTAVATGARALNPYWGDSNSVRVTPEGALINRPPPTFSFLADFDLGGEDAVTATSRSGSHPTYVANFCANSSGGQYQTPSEPYEYTWSDFDESNSGPGKRTTYIGAYVSASISSPTARAERFVNVAYARDPVTLAIIVQVSFEGSKMTGGNQDKDWTFAVDNTGAKELKDIFKSLPENATILRSAQINSLVSI